MQITQEGAQPVGLMLPYDKRGETVSSTVKGKMLSSARWLAREIRKRIRDQVYNWPDLTERYLQWKEEQGLDTRTLIAYGYYINAIQAWETKGGVVVGVEDRVHRVSGIPLRLIGLWLEYGTFNPDGSVRMPARPHWRPTILDWKNNKYRSDRREIQKMMADDAKKSLRTALRKTLKR